MNESFLDVLLQRINDVLTYSCKTNPNKLRKDIRDKTEYPYSVYAYSPDWHLQLSTFQYGGKFTFFVLYNGFDTPKDAIFNNGICLEATVDTLNNVEIIVRTNTKNNRQKYKACFNLNPEGYLELNSCLLMYQIYMQTVNREHTYDLPPFPLGALEVEVDGQKAAYMFGAKDGSEGTPYLEDYIALGEDICQLSNNGRIDGIDTIKRRIQNEKQGIITLY